MTSGCGESCQGPNQENATDRGSGAGVGESLADQSIREGCVSEVRLELRPQAEKSKS